MNQHHSPVQELYVPPDSAQKLKRVAADLVSGGLTARQTCDLELLTNSGFSPFKSLLGKVDYESVAETMRLPGSTLWPMPITLYISEEFAAKVEPGQDIALRDAKRAILATLSISYKWFPNKPREAQMVFGADDLAHPAVNYLHHVAGPVHLGGAITGIQPPAHCDFRARRDPLISLEWGDKERHSSGSQNGSTTENVACVFSKNAIGHFGVSVEAYGYACRAQS